MTFPIVCFSHLAWDERLYQRPQQILFRLAAMGHPVYYFACVGHHQHKAAPMAGPVAGAPGVQVFTLPFAPGVKKFKGLRRWMAALKVSGILSKNHVQRPVLWFYHPMLFALGYAHADAAIVYDVMDHFPSFDQSDDELYFEELTLLAEADIVFTGGHSLDRHARSMVEALTSDLPDGPLDARKRSKLASIHCYPSGVDLPHFQRAAEPSLEQHPSVADVPRPVFGYFGAVDERVDWDLLRQLAGATAGTILLAGPKLGVTPTDLPANVVLPGGIPYSELPALLKGFDVCMLPFKATSLVSYISPTKTPEYLAGGKPVVSTPIPDVVSDYGDIVKIARTAEEFVMLCLEAAGTPIDPNVLAKRAMERARTWDQIAGEMRHHLAAKIGQQVPAEHATR